MFLLIPQQRRHCAVIIVAVIVAHYNSRPLLMTLVTHMKIYIQREWKSMVVHEGASFNVHLESAADEA